jgi:hypothetical protein
MNTDFIARTILALSAAGAIVFGFDPWFIGSGDLSLRQQLSLVALNLFALAPIVALPTNDPYIGLPLVVLGCIVISAAAV